MTYDLKQAESAKFDTLSLVITSFDLQKTLPIPEPME
jgi:hypothetical protein